jgi:hypothetical protein
MKKITQRTIYIYILFLALVITGTIKGQSPTLSITTSQICYSAGNNTATALVVPLISSATNYSWVAAAAGPSTACPITINTITTSGSNVSFNFACCGAYTINCFAYNSSNVLVGTVTNTYYVACAPGISITGSSSSASLCPGAPITLTAFGGVTYTWSNGSTGASIIVTPTANICYSVIAVTASGCSNIAAYCQQVTPAPISINGPTLVCEGSSAVYTANGASTYTWSSSPSSGATSTILLTIPCAQYTVTGTGSNGCFGMNTIIICHDTMCAYVWPGDANSDGTVNSSDVLEIGLSYAMTGTARSPGGNAYTSQFASCAGWIGYGSTGKRRVHIDCNGDGTINVGDTLAIYNNYSLTHPFRPSESSSNPDISLVCPQNTATQGMWNKADIMLGSTTSPINQLYGVTFDINYDNSLIETNSAYIVYTASFLNASNQNVQFKKVDFANSKIYAASVRENGINVSGSGKIGEFWFKVKTGLPANSTLNLSVSNSGKIGNTGVSSALTNGSTVLNLVASTVGIQENNLSSIIQYFPNPAGNQLTLQSDAKKSVTFGIYDIVGREIINGEFTNSKTLDLSAFENGTYVIRFGSGFETSYKRFVVEK